MLHPGRTLTIESVDVEARALDLRKRGLTYDQVAVELGVANRSVAWKIVQRALQDTIQEPADELRAMEGQRLDALLGAVWPKALDGDVKSVGAALQILDRRAKLFNLDLGKTRLEVTGEDGGPIQLEQQVDPNRIAAIMELAAELGLTVGGTSPIDVADLRRGDNPARDAIEVHPADPYDETGPVPPA